MSIECTTSAKSTVTCLYSADWVAWVSRVPHSPQNLAVGLDCAPQEPQNSPVAVSPPPPSPLGSTSVSFHRWSTMSVISPCHLRHQHLGHGGRHKQHQGLCAYRDDDPNRCWRCHVSRAPEDAVCPRCKAAEADRPVIDARSTNTQAIAESGPSPWIPAGSRSWLYAAHRPSFCSAGWPFRADRCDRRTRRRRRVRSLDELVDDVVCAVSTNSSAPWSTNSSALSTNSHCRRTRRRISASPYSGLAHLALSALAIA